MSPRFIFLKKNAFFSFFCLFFEGITRERINMAKNQDKPHRKVFIGFLGAGSYTVCNYYFDSVEDRICNVRHVQEAIVRHECQGWTENDRILIFLTKDAKDNNWEDGEFDARDRDYNTIPPIEIEPGKKNKWGLRHQLIKAAKGIGNDEDESTAVDKKIFPESIITPISLDCEGFSEAEIWHIFSRINENIQDEDEIYFDFTSGFRSLPMLGMVLLTYLKNTKNVTIGQIYYGAFEKMGPAVKVKTMPVDDRNAPVLRLKSFSDIMDFSTAAGIFGKYGNGLMLVDKITDWTKSIRAQKLSPHNGENSILKSLDELRSALNRLTLDLQTCRGMDVVEAGIFDTKNKWFGNYSNASNNPEYKALSPILDLIRIKFEKFNPKRDVRNGFVAAEWCCDNSMYQQSVTFLQETIVTYGAVEIGLKYDIFSHRKLVEKYLLKNRDSYGNEKGWEDYLDELAESGNLVDEKEVICKRMSSIPEKLCDVYDSLTSLRNDLNHCGFLTSQNLKGGADQQNQKSRSIVSSVKDAINTIREEGFKNNIKDTDDIVASSLMKELPNEWSEEEKNDIMDKFFTATQKRNSLLNSVLRLKNKYHKEDALASNAEDVEIRCKDLLEKVQKILNEKDLMND